MEKRTIAIAASIGATLLVWAALFSTTDERPPPARTPNDAHEPVTESEPAAPSAVPAPEEPEPEPTPVPSGAPPPELDDDDDDEHSPAGDRPERMGPVDELKAAYESDGRDPEAGATERLIREQFKLPEVPEGMLRHVSCVKSACKLELRWTSNDRHGYMIALMSLINHVSQELAADPVDEDHGQQVHVVAVYVSRTVPSFMATQ